MKYDGLGNRLEMTTYTDGVGNTTRYVLDSGATLTAIGAESTTFYLYGRGVIGTLGESWSYILQDGAVSTRQLVDTEGAVQLSISYTPWGDTLEVYGSGMLNLGYMGGVYDAGTGLIYMGNGQYYDPSTGRFLTRGMKQESTNPYTPWNNDPVGMLIGPFGFLALLFAKKKKHTKLDAIIVVVILLALMGFGSSIAMPVQANSTTNSTYGGFKMPSVPMSYASSPQPATYKATIVANPGAPVEIHTTDELCGIPDLDQIGAGITGFFENLADGYIQGWKNFFTSFEILFSPDSLLWQKEVAYSYILIWGVAHYALAASLVVLAVVGWEVIVLGTPFCVANGTCQQVVVNGADEALITVSKVIGDPSDEIKGISDAICGGSCADELQEATDDVQTLYRAVSDGELEDILNSGMFRVPEHINSLEGKWFTDSISNASKWAELFSHWGNETYRIISVNIPQSIINQMHFDSFLEVAYNSFCKFKNLNKKR